MVVVNGIEKDIEYRMCTRCICDTSMPGIEFDSEGECNFCKLHDKLCEDYPNDEEGQKQLFKRIDKIKAAGKGKKWDCVIGISGGRDSIYLLYLTVRKYGLRPLAVHFNDGFDNPTAGENMVNAARILGVELRTVTSDFRECKDLKKAVLQASVPDVNEGTDLGIGASLYGVAAKENIKYILFGQSFRTEGVKPISWAYFDGDYLRAVHKQFGEVPLRPWQADRPGFHLGVKELAYYVGIKGIKVVAPLYNEQYIRPEAEKIIKAELEWVYPGAHYFDDLYWALVAYVMRVKFNINLQKGSYAALVREGQMEKNFAIEEMKKPYKVEDPNIQRLCLDRLGMTREEFDEIMKLPPKTFYDYPNSYSILKRLRIPIKILTKVGILPTMVYERYFNSGK